MTGRGRRILRAAIVVVAVWTVLEAIAWVGLRATGTPADVSYADIVRGTRCLRIDRFNLGRLPAADGNDEVRLGRVPHPYFGFVLNPAGGDADWRRRNVGPDYETDLRYQLALGQDPRPPGTFTIGIFGASVAVSFAQYVERDPAFVEALAAGIPGLDARDIVVRNMAIGASRQPSQFAIAAHYLDLFDLTINLDGYSEQAIDHYPRLPIEHPMFADSFFPRQGPSGYLRSRAAAEACRWISRPTLWPLLRHSHVVHLAWRSASILMLNAFRADAQPDTQPDNAGNLSAPDIRRLFADYWERYTRMQNAIARDAGVAAYFFLQPNQYVPDSKPMGVDERNAALGDSTGQETALRYVELSRAVKRMAADGVPVHDLTSVFADVSEPVYVDSCCHVNDLGNQRIAQAIASAIIHEPPRVGSRDTR